jgi:hypothetical protein
MPKTSELSIAQATIAMLRKQLDDLRKDPGDAPFTGCGDTSCVVAMTTGMATNGGCRCDGVTLRNAIHYWRRVAQFRQETIRELRVQVKDHKS